jgi:hypothetical protein
MGETPWGGIVALRRPARWLMAVEIKLSDGMTLRTGR